MNIIDTHLPETTGRYFVYLGFYSNGEHLVRYVAHYDVGENKWYKYDPFDLGNEIKEEIDGHITGWIDDDATFHYGNGAI